MSTVYETILLRRGLSSSRTGITPQQGEPIYTTDTQQFYIGDGVTPGGNLVGGTSGSGSFTGVSTLNGLLNNVIVSGFSNVTVVTSGQYLLISSAASGSSGSGITSGQAAALFYPLVGNPSGFITGFNSGQYITSSQTGAFQPSGNYYPSSNPSGFITGLNTGAFVTAAQTGQFQPSGNYYLGNNPSGYITGISTGNLTGVFYPLTGNPSGFILPSQTGQFASSGLVASQTTLISALTGVSGSFYISSNPSGFITGINTGSFITNSQTGAFYPASNPSGFITNGSISGSVASINGISGVITLSAASPLSISNAGNTITVSGNLTGYIQNNQTGVFLSQAQASGLYLPTGSGVLYVLSSQTGLFYPSTNPSGFITGSPGVPTGNLTGAFYPLSTNPSGYITPSQTGQFASAALVATEGVLISALTGVSGNFYLNTNPNGYINATQSGSLTGQFYPLYTNPSGYIVPSQTGQFAASGLVATHSTLISSLTGVSGSFYLNSNPSGFITGVPTGTLTGQFYPLLSNPSNYVTSAQTGVLQPSGNYYLAANPSGFITGFNSGFYVLNSQTGVFVTTGQTGQFASAAIASANAATISVLTGATGSYYLNSNPSGFITISAGFYTLTGQNINLSGTGNINNFYITFSGLGAWTGNMILQATGAALQIDRLMVNLSGNQTVNVYGQTTGNLLFYWTGDGTPTVMEVETSYTGVNFNIDNANFIN